MQDGQRSGALRTLALVSGVYDLALAVPMLLVAPQLAAAMGAPPPVPLINAQLNGVFTLTLAAGYFWAARDVEARAAPIYGSPASGQGPGAAPSCSTTSSTARRRAFSSSPSPTAAWPC
jgi:hypothetical protein